MAGVIRRYNFRGPPLKMLAEQVGASVGLPPLPYVLAFDVKFDDAIADAAFVDELMASVGFVPDLLGTSVLSPEPFVGLVSPSGGVWRLLVDNLGVLTTKKVN